MRGLRIATIGGDGVGPEVLEATLPVLHASGVSVETVELDWGGERLLRTGAPMPADSADVLAARMVMRPGSLDVLLCGNLFGDVLSDLAAGLVGGMGLAPSANVLPGRGPGLFEPVHGSAPDLGGTATTTDLSTSVLTNIEHPAGGVNASPTEHLASFPTSRR